MIEPSSFAYNSDIIKSNIRQISESNISKTTVIFESGKNKSSSLEICLFKKHVMKIAGYNLVSQIFSLLIYFCSNFLKKLMFNWPSHSTEAPDMF